MDAQHTPSIATHHDADCVICFGDIHGHLGAAQAAIALAERLAVKAIFLGDYVDRGPDSFGTVELLAEVSKRHPSWVFLLGNHDLMLAQAIEGRRHPEGYDERTVNETLPTITANCRPAVHAWLNHRPAYHREGRCLFIHGGFKAANAAIETLCREELVWTYGVPKDWMGDTVVRGHQLVDTPKFGDHDINLNTRCGFGGWLTGLMLNTSNATPLRWWKISEDGGTVTEHEL